ncbi:hypothetical protein QUC31_018967 [Theobroma cacao]
MSLRRLLAFQFKVLRCILKQGVYAAHGSRKTCMFHSCCCASPRYLSWKNELPFHCCRSSLYSLQNMWCIIASRNADDVIIHAKLDGLVLLGKISSKPVLTNG